MFRKWRFLEIWKVVMSSYIYSQQDEGREIHNFNLFALLINSVRYSLHSTLVF